MPKLANPDHEKWFNSVSAALAVAEAEDAGAEEDYRALAKNLAGQFKRAEALDGDQSLAKLVKAADVQAQAGEFVAAKETISRAGDLALTLVQSGRKTTAPTAEKKEEGAQPLVGKAKGKRYEGEDQELGWRKEAWNSPAPKSSKHAVTRYETTEEERKASSKDVDKKGRLVAHRDRGEDGKPLDGGDERPIADDTHGYVMDPKTGKIHTFNTQEYEFVFRDGHVERVVPTNKSRIEKLKSKHGPIVQQRIPHHTTPLAGADVAGAGEVKTLDGHIREISDQSGHYKPGEEQTRQTVEHLNKQGALVDERTPREALLELKDKIELQIKAMKAKGAPAYEYAELKKNIKKIDERMIEMEEEVDPDAPMHREAKVNLIGKIGLSDEEFADAQGDASKMYAVVAAKAKKEMAVDLSADDQVRNEVFKVLDTHKTNVAAINLILGKTFSLILSKSQYLQTEGNERQARIKAQASKHAAAVGGGKLKESTDRHEAKLLEEIAKLGGDAALKKLGLDPEHLKPQEQFDVLSGARPVSNVKPKHDKRKETAERRAAIAASAELIEDEDARFGEQGEYESEPESTAATKKKPEPRPQLDEAEMKKVYDGLGGDQAVIDYVFMHKGFVSWAEPIIRDKVSIEDKLDLLQDRVTVHEFWNALPEG